MTTAEITRVSLGLLHENSESSDQMRSWALYSSADLSRVMETTDIRVNCIMAIDALTSVPGVGGWLLSLMYVAHSVLHRRRSEPWVTLQIAMALSSSGPRFTTSRGGIAVGNPSRGWPCSSGVHTQHSAPWGHWVYTFVICYGVDCTRTWICFLQVRVQFICFSKKCMWGEFVDFCDFCVKPVMQSPISKVAAHAYLPPMLTSYASKRGTRNTGSLCGRSSACGSNLMLTLAAHLHTF